MNWNEMKCIRRHMPNENKDQYPPWHIRTISTRDLIPLENMFVFKQKAIVASSILLDLVV